MERKCCSCSVPKVKDEFTKNQWKKSDRVCKPCQQGGPPSTSQPDVSPEVDNNAPTEAKTEAKSPPASSSAVWPEVEAAVSAGGRQLKMVAAERVAGNDQELSSMLLQHLPGITALHIAGGELVRVPTAVAELAELLELTLPHNNIDTVAEYLCDANVLRSLILEHNAVTCLPTNIGRLQALQNVNLAHNNLSSLPPSFAELTSLLSLNLSGNPFTEFPEEIGSCKRISILVMCHTDLEGLNPAIEELGALHTLDLSHNKMTGLPLEILGCCKNIKELKLDTNPYKDKKFNKTVKEPVKRIVAYLKKHDKKGRADKKKGKGKEPKKAARIKVFTPLGQEYIKVVAKETMERPHLLVFLMRDVSFDDTTFQAFLDMQTDIHKGVCNKRARAAFGTHDFDKFEDMPLMWEARAPSDISFIPLRYTDEPLSADNLESLFVDAGDLTMVNYLKKLKKCPRWAALYAGDHMLSLPPVINSQFSAMTADTRNILVEVSSAESMEACYQAAGALLNRFSLEIHGPETTLTVEPIHVRAGTEGGKVLAKWPTAKDVMDIIYE